MSCSFDSSDNLSCCIHYGYRFRIKEEDQITDALSLNAILPEPLLIVSLLPTISMDDPYSVLDPNVIFGITVDQQTDIESLLEYRTMLDEFVSGSPFLEGFVLENMPRFYSGIPWLPDTTDQEEVSEEQESDEQETTPDSSSYSSQEEEQEQEEEEQEEEDLMK